MLFFVIFILLLKIYFNRKYNNKTLSAQKKIIMETKITQMTLQDVDLVIPIYIEYYNSCEGGTWTNDKAKKRINQVVTILDSRCYILENKNEIIGFAMGYFKQYDDIISYMLEEIVVKKEWQNQGIGSKFLAGIEKEVLNLGASLVELIAINDDMHHHFYTKAGYKTATNHISKSKWLL